MGCTIKTSFCSHVTFSRRSPVAMSNGCAPVLASYSAITLFTSSMSAVAGSYSRSVVSPSDENVRILDFMFGLLRDVPFRFPVGKQSVGWVPKGHIAPFPTVVKMAFRGADEDRVTLHGSSCLWYRKYAQVSRALAELRKAK